MGMSGLLEQAFELDFLVVSSSDAIYAATINLWQIKSYFLRWAAQHDWFCVVPVHSRVIEDHK